MYQYFYRLLDRYNRPITALAIYTDSNERYLPEKYEYRFLGTRQLYEFNTYKIIVQNEAALLAHPNPFALVVLTVLSAIKRKKASDRELLDMKIDLFRHLLKRKIDKQTARALATFLKTYVRF